MISPNPALVSQRGAARIPRLALILFCAAYVLPGVFGRDPWKSADVTSFGYMVRIAGGQTPWLAPTVGGLPADAALLPYWVGAVFIRIFGSWLDPALAARVPFALLLVLALVLTWCATYHLARTEAAQPLAFAFGGEADPVDYAWAIADGALLALIASLGLLQLGHETTPELAQLAAVALFLYSLAASPFRQRRARVTALLALPALAASGAPSIAVAMGLVGTVICQRSSYLPVRRFVPWVAVSTLLAATVATALGAWVWRLTPGAGFLYPAELWSLLRLVAWFTSPAWPLAVWTVWRWRRHLTDRHIAIPLGIAAVSTAACLLMSGFDRAMLLGLPPLAVLAAFALPTLQRGTAAAIDWFSVCFFSIIAIVIWVVYLSMQTGVPAPPAINIARLSPGYLPRFSPLSLVLAVIGTVAWLWLVRWRTRRSRHALWKSLVLPASGVALAWLLVMTLLLPPLDHARSYRSLVQRVAQQVPRGECVIAPGMSRGQVSALEYFGGYRVDAVSPIDASSCRDLLMLETLRRASAPGPAWALLGRERRNTSEQEITAIYKRRAGRG